MATEVNHFVSQGFDESRVVQLKRAEEPVEIIGIEIAKMMELMRVDK